MRCPFCLAIDSRVVDSRDVQNGDVIRRRRECPECKRRFTTYERIAPASLIVVKKDGRREDYNPEKLKQKLRVALTKRPVGDAEIEALIDRIEGQLLALGSTEVSSSTVGELVLKELKALDQVAYIRYASVYRQFEDIEEMRREVEGLRGPEPD